MKTNALFHLSALAALVLPLSSCVMPGPGGDPDVYDPAVAWRRPSPGTVHGSITTSYIYSSGGYGLCGVCGYSPCRCRHGDGHVDKDRLRILGGDLDGKERPKGEHPASWYRERGYDLGKLHVHDSDGTHVDASRDRGHSNRDHDRHSDSDRHRDSGRSSRDDNDKKGGGIAEMAREHHKKN